MKNLDLASALSIPNLEIYLKAVEDNLRHIVDSNNPYIKKPLKRLINARSKRLRPTFIIAIAASQGKIIDKTVINGCAAVELLHIASLIHDDIMDKAKVRWGRPTINSQEGNNQAILVGDFVFGKAFSTASLVGQQAAGLIGQAMIDLCDGQSREIGDELNLNRSIKSLKLAHAGKTAALFEVTAKFGAICSNLSAEQTAVFGSYGFNFGMAFQLIDDLLDLLSTTDLLGKPVGNDIREGVYTLPVLLALKSKSSTRLKTLIQQQRITGTDEILKILIRSGAIRQTVDQAQRHNQTAAKQLNKLKSNATLNGLQLLPQNYFEWSMHNLVAPRYRTRLSGLLD